VFWSDERYVPLSDERSNAGMAYRLLLDHVPIPDSNVFPMYRDDLEPPGAAEQYEKTFLEIFSDERPRLDVTLLGCGKDGHTASLFSGSPILNERNRLVAAVSKPGEDIFRLTMTPKLLNASRSIMFMAYGADKAGIVQRVLADPAGSEILPAQAVTALSGSTYWLLDYTAAAHLARV
jgi:6-phosphogluconolactonase